MAIVSKAWNVCFLFVCFCLAERSQDSEVVLLSDSNSTQDAFTDPTSSQDSSHKPVSVKAGSSSSESTTPVKDSQPTPDEAGILDLEDSHLNFKDTFNKFEDEWLIAKVKFDIMCLSLT